MLPILPISFPLFFGAIVFGAAVLFPAPAHVSLPCVGAAVLFPAPALWAGFVFLGRPSVPMGDVLDMIPTGRIRFVCLGKPSVPMGDVLDMIPTGRTRFFCFGRPSVPMGDVLDMIPTGRIRFVFSWQA